ncbi:energy transducer TonB [Fibrella arboris]|uniref:energy transducer TonB n=1 Tax=Fibrella arboris TaxID=3242486 RepID=UPI00352119C6
MRANLQCPQSAQFACARGNIIVEFVINTDGTTGDFVILTGLDSACNQEAIRLVEAMPAWTPGTLAGEPVKVKLVLPISFSDAA